ncbi:MAG: diacylglycerol kinase family protein [Cyanobacteriota bacterium ELA615]|jgi:diacylglycerol kinase (ATP)
MEFNLKPLQQSHSRGKIVPIGIVSVEKKDDPSVRPLSWKVASNLLVSFQYAADGIRYAFTTQRNFRIHTVMATAAVFLGFACSLSSLEMALIVLTSALVMVLELINTALESVVDLTIGHSYHKLAKIAKDCAAGAVLISALTALFVAALIFLPAIYHKFF